MNWLAQAELAQVATKAGAQPEQVIAVIESWAPKAQRALLHPNWDDHKFAWELLREVLLAPTEPKPKG